MSYAAKFRPSTYAANRLKDSLPDEVMQTLEELSGDAHPASAASLLKSLNEGLKCIKAGFFPDKNGLKLYLQSEGRLSEVGEVLMAHPASYVVEALTDPISVLNDAINLCEERGDHGYPHSEHFKEGSAKADIEKLEGVRTLLEDNPTLLQDIQTVGKGALRNNEKELARG